MEKEKITEQTLLSDCLSLRALRTACVFYRVEDKERVVLTIGDLSNIPPEELYKVKNCGYGTVEEVRLVCLSAGIVYRGLELSVFEDLDLQTKLRVATARPPAQLLRHKINISNLQENGVRPLGRKPRKIKDQDKKEYFF